MGYIKSGLFISLDGVIESPETWHFQYFNDEMGAAVGELMADNDAMLLGRQTYDEFAGLLARRRRVRPDHRHHERLAQVRRVDHARPMPTWENSSVVSGDVAAELATLKQENRLGTTGSATLVRWLLEQGLVDELHLLVHPVVVGHGKKLFADGTTVPLEPGVLDHVQHRRAAPGVRARSRVTTSTGHNGRSRLVEGDRPCATW